MASIVQRNKSFSVVYTIYDGDKKKQKWETYHSYECFLLGKHTVERVCSGLSPLRRDRLWC